MPCDSTPRILAGFKLHKTATRRFSICSIGIHLAKPLTIVRGTASPKSIFSTYNVSASGCFDTSTIFPTRISKRCGPSSTTSAAAVAGAAFFVVSFVGGGYAFAFNALKLY